MVQGKFCDFCKKIGKNCRVVKIYGRNRVGKDKELDLCSNCYFNIVKYCERKSV